MSGTGRVGLGWACVAALLILHSTLAGPPDATTHEPGPLRRLIGPFAALAADVQWVRFERARRMGMPDLAIAHAEAALGLDPLDARGWDLLAAHLALDLGSPATEADPRRRLAWLEAGLAAAARGEERCDDPAALAFLQGYLLHVKAENDAQVDWPGGAGGLWRSAAEHYARAAQLGYPSAEFAATYALERAAN